MPSRRLFCTGEGENCRFALAPTVGEASETLGSPARYPSPDDVRRFWQRERMDEVSAEKIAKRLGVTRQMVCGWRKKAGETAFRSLRQAEKIEKLRGIFASENVSISEGAARVGLESHVAKRIAAEMGVAARQGNLKRPSDDELVAKATGKCWRELAAACGMKVQSLRMYVYRTPGLSARMRAVMVRAPVGSPSHGRVDVEQLKAMFAEGATVYRIAETQGVETMSVLRWLHRLGLKKSAYVERSNEAARMRRKNKENKDKKGTTP